MSFFTVIANADLFVKFILFLLALISIWSWGVFFEKMAVFKVKFMLSESFRREFNSGEMLDVIYNRLSDKKKIHSPLARIFHVGMKELNMSNIRNIDFGEDYSDGIKKNIRERIISAVSIERSKIIQEMKIGISSLATVGSLSPFIGLLGTVWGIMNTFYSIANVKVVNLATVIPGIAEALVGTIMGLIVAIPAVLFYNILVSKLNFFVSDSEIFGLDLSNILSRELDVITTNSYTRKIKEKAEMEKRNQASRPAITDQSGDDDDNDDDD